MTSLSLSERRPIKIKQIFKVNNNIDKAAMANASGLAEKLNSLV
jgi:hypothetical protein